VAEPDHGLTDAYAAVKAAGFKASDAAADADASVRQAHAAFAAANAAAVLVDVAARYAWETGEQWPFRRTHKPLTRAFAAKNRPIRGLLTRLRDRREARGGRRPRCSGGVSGTGWRA